MSRKTIAFSIPAPRAPEMVAPSERSGAGNGSENPEAWVRERALNAPAAADQTPPAASLTPAGPLMFDLAAERTLVEALFLSLLAPWALGWFWLMRATSGKPRF